MPDIVLHHPYWLWLLLALPLWAWLQGRAGKPAALEFSSVRIAQAIGGQAKSRIGRWLLGLRSLALACLIITLARPQWGRGVVEESVSGIDIMLAVDLSSSMLALDFSQGSTPITRLEVVRDVLAQFIPKRPHDRLGLVAFAGNPYLVSPLTLNHDWLTRNLDRLQIGLIEDGTAIGSGLGMSVNHLRNIQGKSRIVILLTDGVNNSGTITPIAAAEAAASFNTKVYTILVGKGGIVPVYQLDPRTNRIAVDPWGRPYIAQAEVPIDAQTLQ
ncbi:MAG TPA: VWA domain-containing protein, partial [Opitutales bacterium]|nr:VWA domain-containing protein [Opitutales bacterium]